MNLNGVEYYYVKNAQGDIIGLYDKTGTQVVSYSYDSWAQLISTTGSKLNSCGLSLAPQGCKFKYSITQVLRPGYCRLVSALRDLISSGSVPYSVYGDWN